MEFDLIDVIRERVPTARRDVVLGIGDDAALLAPPAGHELVVAVDTLVAGVHFPTDTAPQDVGWKALAVNLSDLVAMGATPAWALLALTLSKPDRAWVEAFADGFAALARQHDVALVGGDTTRGPLAVSVCVHGFVPSGQALTRSAAQPGDVVFVTGTLGDGAGALRCLEHAKPAAMALRQRLDRPQPRVTAGQALRALAHACIDVSDGLVADLGHICRRSGVGAIIEAARLPISTTLSDCFAAGAARELALTGGDDYELCFTVAPERCDRVHEALAQAGCAATRIGRIVAGEGVHVHDADGHDITPQRRGWEHFDA